MRIENLILPLLKDSPKAAEVASHKLMLRAGMIKQVSSGIYSWLPLGVRVLNKLTNIIRKHMDDACFQEMVMPSVQPFSIWKKSGRDIKYGPELLQFIDRHDNEFVFAPTSEEVMCDSVLSSVSSFKQLPIVSYQISWKFRDEIRPRFGALRAREFLMKDAYSFDISEYEAIKSYYKIFDIYIDILNAIGLNALATRADNGNMGGSLSHEFNILSDIGEGEVYYDSRMLEDKKNIRDYYVASDDIHDPNKCNVPEEYLAKSKAIEVGHIFMIDTVYTKKLNLGVQGADSKIIYPYMGCYGLGVSRLIAAIIEASHDSSGIIWPEAVAPFTISIINLHPNDVEASALAEKIYAESKAKGLDVLLDCSSKSPGQKLKIHDLIGVPKQVIISSKNIQEGQLEVKIRKTGKSYKVPISDDLLSKL